MFHSQTKNMLKELMLVFLPAFLICMYEFVAEIFTNHILLIGIVECIWIVILKPEEIFKRR
jgi:hypothetical protein